MSSCRGAERRCRPGELWDVEHADAHEHDPRSRVALTITSPRASTRVSGSRVTVAGTVVPSDATVDVASWRATVSSGGRFSVRAKVGEGTTTIDVIARAPARSPSESAIVITHSGKAAGGSSSADGNFAGGIPVTSTSCGGGLSVSVNTSCAFARNVQAAYEGKGADTYMIYNPLTKQRYSMTCKTGAVLVICRGAQSAYLYFER